VKVTHWEVCARDRRTRKVLRRQLQRRDHHAGRLPRLRMVREMRQRQRIAGLRGNRQTVKAQSEHTLTLGSNHWQVFVCTNDVCNMFSVTVLLSDWRTSSWLRARSAGRSDCAAGSWVLPSATPRPQGLPSRTAPSKRAIR